MLDQGSSVWLFDGQRLWAGLSSERLVQLPESSTPGLGYPFSPLWALDLVRGLTEAEREGTEVAPGVSCADSRPARTSAGPPLCARRGLGAPSAERFEKLLALPMTVWLDDRHARRVRVETEDAVHTVELLDSGTAKADWSRLPARA